mmetsp:Transcript_86375/g.241718  ORF Transcript_86375/g.241718 Transcript_86375/m.241718 type:complete len:203 (+) Transcript_86375:46-654(+)
MAGRERGCKRGGPRAPPCRSATCAWLARARPTRHGHLVPRAVPWRALHGKLGVGASGELEHLHGLGGARRGEEGLAHLRRGRGELLLVREDLCGGLAHVVGGGGRRAQLDATTKRLDESRVVGLVSEPRVRDHRLAVHQASGHAAPTAMGEDGLELPQGHDLVLGLPIANEKVLGHRRWQPLLRLGLQRPDHPAVAPPQALE